MTSDQPYGGTSGSVSEARNSSASLTLLAFTDRRMDPLASDRATVPAGREPASAERVPLASDRRKSASAEWVPLASDRRESASAEARQHAVAVWSLVFTFDS